MLVNFKTIAGHAFQLDCDPCWTLAKIKVNISEAKGSENFPVELQKLIYKGKVRGDDEKLSDLKLDEGGDKKHIIIMCQTSKPKPSITEIRETGGPVISASSGLGVDEDLKISDEVNTVASSEDLLISQIQLMGYAREKAVSALKVSNNNVAEALQFLILQEAEQKTSEKVKYCNEVSKSKVSFASPLPETMATRRQERMKRFGLNIKPEAGLSQKPVESHRVIKDVISKIEIVEKTLRSDGISSDEHFKDIKAEADGVYAEKKKARLKRFGFITPETEVLEKRAKRFAPTEETNLKEDVINGGSDSAGIIGKQVQEK